LGVLFSTLYVPGFWHVMEATSSAGPRQAFVMFCLFCATAAFGAAFHAAHAFVGIGLHAVGSTPGAVSASGVKAPFETLKAWLSSLGALLLVAGSVFFTLLVGAGRSQYPRWFAACAPFVLVLGFAGLGWVAPAPVGGYLWPVCFNLAMLVFFALSLYLTGFTTSQGSCASTEPPNLSIPG
jgi:hypothetical protein